MIPGILVFEPRVFADERGFFLETFNAPRYAARGFNHVFVQDNWSHSVKGTLRGLHFQHPRAQGKLAQVVQGRVWDVAVDVRFDSPTFKKWFGLELSAENKRQLWIPPGFAHGFYVLSETADFLYKCTDVYVPEEERSFRWNDPAFAIKWPLEGEPLLSDKDARAPFLESR